MAVRIRALVTAALEACVHGHTSVLICRKRMTDSLKI
jgi:predicted transcriptional regulator